MNILLDLYLEKNLGDDLFLQTILKKYPNDNLYITTQEVYKEMEQKHPNLTVITLPKIANAIIHKAKLTHLTTKFITRKYQIEALATVGGSIFTEYDGWEKLFKIRENNWNYFKKKNKPVFVIGANFGPYKTTKFLESYKELFKNVTDICFRDKYSASLFQELKTVRCETDVVVSYDITPYNKIAVKKAIGISVLDLSSRPKLEQLQEKYLERMVSLSQAFLFDGYEVHLMSFCKSEGDEKAANLIMQRIGQNRNLKKLNYTGDIASFLNQFKSFQAVIGCRFHSFILSYIFSKPVVPISYSNKTSDFISDWNLSSEPIRIEDIETLSYEKVVKIVNSKTELNPELIQSGDRQFEAMASWMAKKSIVKN